MFTLELMDGTEYQITEPIYQALHEADLIYQCEDCSSEFSGRVVAHPNVGQAHLVRRMIEAQIAKGEAR